MKEPAGETASARFKFPNSEHAATWSEVCNADVCETCYKEGTCNGPNAQYLGGQKTKCVLNCRPLLVSGYNT